MIRKLSSIKTIMAKMKENRCIDDSIGKINNRFQCFLFGKYVLAVARY